MHPVSTEFDQIIELDAEGHFLRRWIPDTQAPGRPWTLLEDEDPKLITAGTRCRALIPGPSVLITQVDLPIKSRGEWREKAAAYALEERLIADIESLHFSVSKSESTQTTAEVAVVAKKDIERWQAGLRESGLEPVSLVPDTALIPRPEKGLRFHLKEERCWLIKSQGEAIAFDADLITQIISTISDQPLVITYESSTDQDAAQRTAETAMQQGIAVTGPDKDPCIRPMHAPLRCELLSGPYAPNIEWQKALRRFRWPFALAAAAALMHLGLLALETRALSDEATHLADQLEAKFAEILPETTMVAPRRQIESVLRQSGIAPNAGTANTNPIPLLNHLGAALADNNAMQVLRLQFQAGQLDAELRAPSLQAFNALTASFPTEGLEVELQQASTDQSGTIGRVRLQGKTP